MVSSESAPPGFIKHAHFTEHPFTRHSGWRGALEFLCLMCKCFKSSFIFSATTAEACHFFQWQALTNSTQAQSQSCTSHETQLWHQGPWHTECSLKWADGLSASLSLNPNPHSAQVLLVEGMDHLLCAWQALQLPLLAIFFLSQVFLQTQRHGPCIWDQGVLQDNIFCLLASM